MFDSLKKVGNHDQSRIASKYGTYKVDLMNILIKTLPGITITYYVRKRSIETQLKFNLIDLIFEGGRNRND